MAVLPGNPVLDGSERGLFNHSIRGSLVQIQPWANNYCNHWVWNSASLTFRGPFAYLFPTASPTHFRTRREEPGRPESPPPGPTHVGRPPLPKSELRLDG